MASGDILHLAGEVDVLALEIVIAGNLVRIDAAPHRVGDIGERCGRQLDFELDQRLFARGHVVAVEHIGWNRDGIILRIKTDACRLPQNSQRSPGGCIRRFAVDPDEAVAARVKSLDRLGDIGRRVSGDVWKKLARTGWRVHRRRCRNVGTDGTGHHRIDELCRGDPAQRLGLIGIILRRRHLGQRPRRLFLHGLCLLDTRQRLVFLGNRASSCGKDP